MKLYLFAIGGTGARIVKSLVMLLASGVQINADKIIPIFIDPDTASGNLTETMQLINQYKEIRSSLSFDEDSKMSFFKTEIASVNNDDNYIMNLQNVQNKSFEDYIDLPSLQNEDKANFALTSALFSEENLKADMQVGFKGNPNMGSVVLNQFADTPVFNSFAEQFQKEDRIFVVSSIFGGTGASGFPLLVKNLRNIDQSKNNSQYIKDAPLGAISVLPYFQIQQDEKSSISSSSFCLKTRAALSYYSNDLKELNTLYYIGDTYSTSNQYKNIEGGANQKNQAHVIEVISALSVFDFMDIKEQEFNNKNGLACPGTVYKEFGFKENSSSITFHDLCSKTNQRIQKPLTEYLLFVKFMKEEFPTAKKSNQEWFRFFDQSFFDGKFYKANLQVFNEIFYAWCTELESNQRAFSPFHLEENNKKVFGLVKGITPYGKGLSFFRKQNYCLVEAKLNAAISKYSKEKKRENVFVHLFHGVIEELLEKKKLI